MKKICPIVLLIWPYLFFPAAIATLEFEGQLAWIIGYCVLTPVVYIAGIVWAVKNKNIRSLARWNLAFKLCHIPAYISIFFSGVMFAGQMLVGIPFGLILIPILVAVDVLLLCTTSSYGICALIRARKDGRISTACLVVNGIMHFIFVLDVISSIVVFCKVRKQPAFEN